MNRLVRILQVEDSPEDRMMTAEGLSEASSPAELRAVPTTKEAIAIVSVKGAWHPSVVLLDLSLPGESGFAMLQFIKGQPDLQRSIYAAKGWVGGWSHWRGNGAGRFGAEI